MRYRNLVDRLVSRSIVCQETHCWIWTGRVEPNGYAKIGFYKGGGRAHERVRNQWVHRVAYEAFKETTIPEGMTVHHTCYNPICINPAHLTLLTNSENAKHARTRANVMRYSQCTF